jgi:hypothetical protein
MKLSLVGCASVVALAAFTMTGNGAIAAEQTNQMQGPRCDAKNMPACERGNGGKVVTPSGSNDANGPHGPSGNSGAGSSGNVDIQRSHNGGGDKPHSNPKSSEMMRHEGNPGEGCDLRVRGSGCEPGGTETHAVKVYNPPEAGHPSSSSSGDHQHRASTAAEKEQTRTLNQNSSNHGTDQPPPPHPQ